MHCQSCLRASLSTARILSHLASTITRRVGALGTRCTRAALRVRAAEFVIERLLRLEGLGGELHRVVEHRADSAAKLILHGVPPLALRGTQRKGHVALELTRLDGCDRVGIGAAALLMASEQEGPSLSLPLRLRQPRQFL